VSPLASRLLAGVAGLAIGALFLTLAFRGTPPAEVAAALADARWLGPGCEIIFATGLFAVAKSVRWRALLGAPVDLSLGVLLRAVLAGLALNALLPHSGELVRAFGLKRRAGAAPSAVLSSIVAERVFDLFAVLVLGGYALAAVPVGAGVAAALRLLAAIAALGAAAIVLALRFPKALPGIVAALARPLPARAGRWLAAELGKALAGLEPVRSPRTALRVFGWSLLQWLAVALAVHGCGAAVGLALGAAACGLVVVGIVVAFLLPNAPGYAGSVQVAFLVALAPLGFPEAAALAASVIYQLLMVLPLILAGLACLGPTLRER
jgi:uncharacterized membrane protein YbhN (UPF0104 family)